MRFLSVCSGIEAASVAWNPLGWKAQAFSEIEPFPCALLAHHYPKTPNRGDMTKFQEWPDEPIDLLCGGTPCQSFSVAGLRKGLDDPRGNLMLTFGAIAGKYRPRWLVWENVPGVLSSNGGRDFGTFLGMLGQLGYGFAYRVLDAQYFGVAQRRRRVFVVGHLGDWRPAAAVLFERHSLQGHPAPSREARQAVAGTVSSRTTGGGGLGTDFECSGGLQTVSNCLNAKGGAGRMDAESETLIPTTGAAFDVAHSLRGEGFDASEDGTGRGTPLMPVAFDTTQCTSAANRSNPKPGDPCHPLAAGAHAPAIAHVDVMPTMMSGANMPAGHNARSGHSKDAYIVPTRMAARRLTPRECERLQGFPDDYTAIPYRGKTAADGPRYKALGNSWAVPVVRWIGQRIDAVESILAVAEAA